eukprot:1158708-Pelagomonas_calceolata.AAC.1
MYAHTRIHAPSLTAHLPQSLLYPLQLQHTLRLRRPTPLPHSLDHLCVLHPSGAALRFLSKSALSSFLERIGSALLERTSTSAFRPTLASFCTDNAIAIEAHKSGAIEAHRSDAPALLGRQNHNRLTCQCLCWPSTFARLSISVSRCGSSRSLRPEGNTMLEQCWNTWHLNSTIRRAMLEQCWNTWHLKCDA